MQPVVVDAEVVGDLVHHGDAHLLDELLGRRTHPGQRAAEDQDAVGLGEGVAGVPLGQRDPVVQPQQLGLPGRRLVLQRNRFYKGTRPQHVTRYVADLGAVEGSIVDDIASGKIDYGFVTVQVWSERGAELARRYGVNKGRFFVGRGHFLRMFVLNTSRPLFRKNPKLRQAFESHLEETQGQITRLEQVFESLDEKARGKHCDGIAGIIEEGKSIMEEDFGETTMDACLIAAGQRAEHYEMAAYGTLVAWARGLGQTEAADLLQQTLDEEKAADQKLSQLAEGGINQEAADAASPDEDEEEEQEKPAAPTRTGRARPSASDSKRSRR